MKFLASVGLSFIMIWVAVGTADLLHKVCGFNQERAGIVLLSLAITALSTIVIAKEDA